MTDTTENLIKAKCTVCLLMLLLSGCMSAKTELQMPDETVRPMLTGEDCVGIYFGIATGTARMSEAMKTYHNVQQERQTSSGSEKVTVLSGLLIRRIHSVVLKDEGALGFGRRCLEVTGEP
jgi:hypothetical protein